jgi:sodium/bile acid cotransporter 7
LLATLVLATLLPASGVVADMVDILSTVTVVLLFFFHGAKLARSAVVAGLTHWRLHLVILACTFVMFPLLGLLTTALFGSLLNPALGIGLLFLAALPSTVQSSIAFVSVAKGNVPAAIASASASQVAGVVLTPVLMGLMVGVQGGEVPLSGIGKVALQILLPFVAGHMVRPWIGDFVARNKSTIGLTDRATILIAVYSAFSSAVLEGLWSRLPPKEFALLLLVCCLMLTFGLLFTSGIAKLLGFARDDQKVVVFCGTKKSLVQGVPMGRVLFPGPDLGLILLPIMIFHQVQLMVCAYIARRYARGVENNEQQQ